MLSWSPIPSSSSSSVDYSRWSPSSSKVHAASLVDPLTHPEELLQLVDIELSRPVIEYVADYISDVVDEALERGGVVILHSTPYLSDFTTFVSRVLCRAQVTPATLLVALSYLDRASDKLCISVDEWALERVFLGALICAAKYANDSSLRNIHWAMCTGIFGSADIGRIEAEFLDVMQWRMGVSEAGGMAHREGLMAAIGVSVVARPLPLPPRPQHRHTSSTSSTTSSVPSLSPPSPRSPSLSPSLSPPTPPLPAYLPIVPIDTNALADLEAGIEYTAKHAVRTRCTLLRSLPIPMIALPCRTRARARPQFEFV
ncbi:hypothetical protein FB45DRAFT_936085, partial [Roridomyces roridus]